MNKEAPKVFSDLTQGNEGVKTPPPNDSLASISPPVGGRLHSFRRDWQKEKCSSNMLNSITNGYILPLHSKPKLTRVPLSHSGYKAHQKDLALTSCVSPVKKCYENVRSLGFYSHLFLVPKPHQKWRPVIDLSRLNTFLVEERVKMETPESIRASLIPGEWVPSIDLSEVPRVHPRFSSVPVHLPASFSALPKPHKFSQ